MIHANQFSSRGSAAFRVEDGAIVRPRQNHRPPSRHVPSAASRFGERNQDRQNPSGQPVSIRLDAFPDTRVRAPSRSRQSVPRASGVWQRRIKQYGVIVAIIDPPKSIRIGMTAFAEIDISKVTDE